MKFSDKQISKCIRKMNEIEEMFNENIKYCQWTFYINEETSKIEFKEKNYNFYVEFSIDDSREFILETFMYFERQIEKLKTKA